MHNWQKMYSNHLFFCVAVSVGYEYESCPDLVLWERRTVTLQGFEMDSSNLGGWTFNKHHILNPHNGKNILQ